MDRKKLQNRTRDFYVAIIKPCSDFPKNAAGFETAKQLILAAGSVGSNYRATARAKSDADRLKLYWKKPMRVITGLKL